MRSRSSTTRALHGAGAAVAVPEQATGRFETGKTTLKEVEQALGEPNTSRIDAGQRTACYRYAKISATPETFIRMVGPASPGDAELTCCFSFTSSGVLHGLAAGVCSLSVVFPPEVFKDLSLIAIGNARPISVFSVPFLPKPIYCANSVVTPCMLVKPL